jgi:hypothetical protein
MPSETKSVVYPGPYPEATIADVPFVRGEATEIDRKLADDLIKRGKVVDAVKFAAEKKTAAKGKSETTESVAEQK